MVRAPYFDKNGMKKGAWSEDEDAKLKAYMEKNGHLNWRQLPKLAGLSRCGKSCRLRWVNYLRPTVKRGNYTSEEEDLVIKLHKIYGSRWSMIAAKLPGRSDNEIKNHWHTHLRKRDKQNSILSYSTHDTIQNLEEKGKAGISLSQLNEKEETEMILAVLYSKSPSNANNEQQSLSSSSASYHVASNSNSPMLSSNDSFEDFWTKPFLPDTFSSMSDAYSSPTMDLVNKFVSSSYDLDTMADAYLWSVMDFCGL